jgi:UDP-glucose:(glucosyl)LPS alpha-1,2-glucosyltransferase
MQAPKVAVVLPPREPFSPAATGAVGLLVHRLAAAPSAFTSIVLGPPTPEPFPGVAFVPVHPSWLPGGQARRYARGVAGVLAAKRPAVVEVHNRPDVALYLARRFPKLPVLLFLHNDPQGMRRARTPQERARLLATLAGIATVSGYLRRRLLADVQGDIAGGGSVAVLPNCVDLGELPPPGPREPSILFAGRVVADKGADVFVRACARALPALPGWRAEILGADRFGASSPETSFLAALRPQAAAAGVAMTGWRPHTDVVAAMARAAIVVMPSRWPEPFGLTALEAMACGAALVCSARGGLPEVVGNAAVIIDPDDADSLAAAIVALAGDAARRVALGVAGRARARAFDVTIAATALDTLRRKTLAAWPHAMPHPI